MSRVFRGRFVQDQRRISDDRAQRMDENWKTAQALNHGPQWPPVAPSGPGRAGMAASKSWLFPRKSHVKTKPTMMVKLGNHQNHPKSFFLGGYDLSYRNKTLPFLAGS